MSDKKEKPKIEVIKTTSKEVDGITLINESIFELPGFKEIWEKQQKKEQK